MQSVLRKTGQVKIKIWISPRNSVTFNYFFFFCSTRQWGGRYPPANTGGGGERADWAVHADVSTQRDAWTVF